MTPLTTQSLPARLFGLCAPLRAGRLFRSTARQFVFIVVALAFFVGSASIGRASVRLKDIVDVEGVRDNMLVGYGLVIGLNGSGDSLRNSPFTQQSLVGMLERLGVNTRDATSLRTKNVAAVMVTPPLPPHPAHGTRNDARVGARGASNSLRGGQLFVTPLMGADGAGFAVAQGPAAGGGVLALVGGGGGRETREFMRFRGRLLGGGEWFDGVCDQYRFDGWSFGYWGEGVD
ncbi:flagellar P-ring protein precursor FlgI [Azospirillaceae bacterium]